ncbi:MAG: ABC transporter ATP-binding protein/permease [Spirochaetia bacterium]|nr:ABC transporter ATP-binding protein/permease [Spirochaetia bacterium]
MQLLMSLMMVSMVMVRFTRSEASAKRIMDVLDTPGAFSSDETGASGTSGASGVSGASGASEVAETSGALRGTKVSGAPGELLFRHVWFSYEEGYGGRDGSDQPCGNMQQESDGCAVLKDITFSIPPGTTTAVIGSTGSGKTSLVNLIPRLYDVTKGAIEFGGVDIRNMPQKELRSRIGVVTQQAVLFSGTIRENIAFGRPDASDEEILAAAETAQIRDFIEKSEDGLDTHLNQQGVNLSGGQKQRLCIARALLYDPMLIIFDESTSALDAQTAFQFQEALRKREVRQKGSEGGSAQLEEKNQASTLIIGQRIASVMMADSIIVLDDGEIVDQGEHQTLLKRCSLYREIVLSQLGEEALHG